METLECRKGLHIPAGSHLSSLALEASNSLLSPLSSHLGDYDELLVSIVCGIAGDGSCEEESQSGLGRGDASP